MKHVTFFVLALAFEFKRTQKQNFWKDIQWNLSNPTHQVTREMCRIVQDVGILSLF